MTRVMNLPNRLTIGIAAIALLAIAATTTTLATQPSHAQVPAPTVQVADTAVDAPGALDTGTADVRVGSQTGVDIPGAEVAGVETAEAKTAGALDTDTIQSGAGSQTQTGDQTTADVAGAPATN